MARALGIKFCGVTSIEDAGDAVAAGADAVGFNFVPESPRVVDEATARRMAGCIRRRAEIWGVFVNESPDRIRHLAAAVPLDRIQLHGDESPDDLAGFKGLSVVKAFRVREKDTLDALRSFPVWGHLLDAGSDGPMRGGSGCTFDWNLARRVVPGVRLILAGGLTPQNVAEAVRTVGPDWVDAASGVERAPRAKDAGQMRAFVRNAREAVQEHSA